MGSRLALLAAAIAVSLLAVCASAAEGVVDPKLGLSATELAWLAEHPVIRIAPDPNFAPVEWFNQEGDYSGISSDYVEMFEKLLGVRFEVTRGASWNEIVAMARSREIDALTAIIPTAQREEYLAFTRPYVTLKRAIFSSQEINDVHTLADLQGYKIAVVKGSWMDEQLSMRPGMSINRFQDLTTALIATSRGVTDVTGSALDTTAFLRRREGLLNLMAVAELDERVELSIGVRKDWLPLVPILDKALASVSLAEANRIKAAWLDIEEPYFWERPIYRYTAAGLLVLLLASMAVVIVWNRTLNIQVQKRSRQLAAAQMQLIQAEKLESIGRLSAGVAHEVKNPLAIIQMGADYLAQVLDADDPSRDVVSDIEDAVQRADKVIKGLLDFSHNDALELKLGDLNEIVAESLRLVGHEMRKRNITVEESLAENNPHISIDSNKVKQVLINILMNAAHAVDHDGRVSVSCCVDRLGDDVEAGSMRAGDRVLALRVEDTGPGISAEHEAKLFDPFYTTKPVGEGTGLGLSVSRNIVELHRGALDIRNAPEGGAMVTIYFKL